MTPFIIVLDIPFEDNEPVFVNRLLSMGNFLKISTTVYMLQSNLTAVDIRESLKDVDDNRGIFISALTTPAAWRNIDVENDKIKEMYHE